MLHKPRGFICSRSDPEGRPTVYELINGEGAPAERLYTIGRLDFDSEGLILLTNDGEFANRLAHPRHEMSKTYLAWVDEDLSPDDIDALKRGVTNEGERLRLASIQRETGRGAGKPCYRVVLREGKNRQVRRMFDAVGHRVTRLVRVKVGPLELGRLRVGKWRKLLNEEVRALRG
jgi:pseudouridine synthase